MSAATPAADRPRGAEPEKLDCSLVVCTRDRADQLERTLGTIREIRSERSWELVLVDNGSSDRTPEVMEAFARSSRVRVRSVVEPKPGHARARNAGCNTAAGRFIACIDDDCYPRPDYVDAVVRTFESRDAGFIGGRVLLHDPDDAAFTIREGGEWRPLPPHTFPHTGFIIGANMAFRREVYRDVGGFDELLGLGTPFVAEDIAFCARASDRGWKGGYAPEPTVYHHHGRRGAAVEELRAAYDRGRGAYYASVLLDCPTLRVQALKWWYWDLDVALPGQTRREVSAALRYLLHRAGARVRRAGAALRGGRR